MLTRETVVDKIEILEHGVVQVRRATWILENGARIAGPDYRRVAYPPGADVTTEDPKVIAHCNAAWTPEVVAAYRARVAAMPPPA